MEATAAFPEVINGEVSSAFAPDAMRGAYRRYQGYP